MSPRPPQNSEIFICRLIVMTMNPGLAELRARAMTTCPPLCKTMPAITALIVAKAAALTHPYHIHASVRTSARRISLFCPLCSSACAGRWWSTTKRKWRVRWTGWRGQLAAVAATECCRSLLGPALTPPGRYWCLSAPQH